jgi:signal transduction histidine kinase
LNHDQLSKEQVRSLVISQLVDSFLHELANGLRSIVMDVNALTREAACQKSESVMGRLKSLLSEAERVTSLAQRYQTLSGQEVERAESDIVIAVRETFELLTKLKHVRFHLSTKIEAAICEVPKIQIEQVFINIILNSVAAQATNVKVAIEVCAGKGEEEAIVQIIDDGIGMGEDVLGQACEPFFTTSPRGVGLGLFISRQILLRHGGDLSIESSQGNGTTLTIRLPVLDAERTTG